MENNALSGIRILDFSSWVVAPLVTKTLADYGADVVLVEFIKKPSSQRGTLPYKDGQPGINRSGAFSYINPNKLSISLDLNHPKGKDVAKRLAGWADTVVENFTPGVLEKLGFGYNELVKIKKDIILLRLSAQGQTGPYSRHKALGLQLNGLSGYTNFIGYPDREPLSFMFAYPDYVVAFMGVAALCSALDNRYRTGEGCVLDISEYESCLQYMAPYILEYAAAGRETARMGNAHPWAAPHGYFACRGDDAWCSIAVFDDEEWANFGRALDNPAWTGRSDLATALGRKKNEAELNRLVGEWTAGLTAGEVVTTLQNAGIASGIVKKASEIHSDPQLNGRGFFWKMESEEMGRSTYLGQPSVLSATPPRPARPAPRLGEHTEFVCREILGIPEEEFTDLLISGAFGL